MQLICLSASHHHTPVALRECLNLPPEVIRSSLAETPIGTGPLAGISEMVILSTCNRLEIYAVVPGADRPNPVEAAFQALMRYLEQVVRLAPEQVEPFLRRYTDTAVVDHLYHVAAGLDSIAIGESQILGQVSKALETALQLGTARHVLSSLFRAAIFTGKRVQTETEIGRHPVSISTLAVQLAEKTSRSLASQRILVIGAGKMGGATLEALHAHGVQDISLTSRTFEHAAQLAELYQTAVFPYEQLADRLAEADIIFTATAASAPILHQQTLKAVMEQRSQKPLMLIDLAVPRNIDTQSREIAGIGLYDMDDLQSFAQNALSGSREDLARAEAIVSEEAAAYEKLLRIIPFIGELHKKVEDIRQREVEKTLRHMRSPDPEVTEQVEMLSRSLVRKILHEPTMHLRTETNQETLNEYVDTLARLFDLEESEPYLSLEARETWEP